MGGIVATWRFRIAKFVPFRYPRWSSILKFFKRYLLPNSKSDWTETWWEASQWHRDSELLKLFRYPIWPHGSHLEILQRTSSPKPIRLSQNLVGSITVTQLFRIAKLKSFCSISKMATAGAILKVFKWHLLPYYKSDWAKTWWEAFERHGDSELLKSFRSDIQDGHHSSHLEIIQTTSLPNHKLDWAESWWEASEWHRDSEYLESFCLAIQDGLRGHLENLETTSASQP